MTTGSAGRRSLWRSPLFRRATTMCVAMVMGIAGIDVASAQFAMPETAHGGYVLTPGPDGVLRLDSRSGDGARCASNETGCDAIPYRRRPVPYQRGPIDSETGRLQRENSGLRDETKRLKDEAGRIKDETARLKEEAARLRKDTARIQSEPSRPPETSQSSGDAAPAKVDPAKPDAAQADTARLVDEMKVLKTEIASLKDELAKRSVPAREAPKNGAVATKADVSKNADEIGLLRTEIAGLKDQLAKRAPSAPNGTGTARLTGEIAALKGEIASLRDELGKRNGGPGKIDAPLRKEDSLKSDSAKSDPAGSDSKAVGTEQEKSTSKPESKLPNEPDAERTIAIMERVWRRLIDMAERLKDFGGK